MQALLSGSNFTATLMGQIKLIATFKILSSVVPFLCGKKRE